MLGGVTKRFVRGHVKQIVKDNIFQVIGISLLIGFLMYFLHILVGLSFGVQSISSSIQNKLGVYFYIKDNPNKQDETYSKIIEMKDKLETLGMKVQYLSKDDAMKSIERKIPSVLQSFEKYGIKNPLPATVYVLFNNSKDYEKLKAVVSIYQDIISNREDISKIGESMKKQEERIINTLDFTRFIVLLSVFLIVVIVIIICSFLLLTIKSKFDAFRKMIGIQQLLGTPYILIKLPFLLVVLGMTVFGFILSLLCWFITTALLQSFFIKVFEVGLFEMIGSDMWTLLSVQGIELLTILVLVYILGYLYMQQLLIKYEK